MLTKAIDNYKKSAEIETGPEDQELAMEYLVAAYGPDKLNDPSQAEPILRKMIEMDPNEPSNYSICPHLRGERRLRAGRAAAGQGPRDEAERPGVYMQLAAFYNRQGEFDKTMEALHARAEQEPNNPEAFYTIATYYWEKAYRDFTTPEADKMKFVQAGNEAIDKAIKLKPDYPEALTYKNLLLRVQANLEKNPARQQALLQRSRTIPRPGRGDSEEAARWRRRE